MNRTLRFVGLAALVLLALVPGVLAWRAAGEASLSWPGWAALAGGAVVTAALGGGLMALVFYSDRSGFDERADQAATRALDDD